MPGSLEREYTTEVLLAQVDEAGNPIDFIPQRKLEIALHWLNHGKRSIHPKTLDIHGYVRTPGVDLDEIDYKDFLRTKTDENDIETVPVQMVGDEVVRATSPEEISGYATIIDGDEQKGIVIYSTDRAIAVDTHFGVVLGLVNGVDPDSVIIKVAREQKKLAEEAAVKIFNFEPTG